jgi:hypothetical protein
MLINSIYKLNDRSIIVYNLLKNVLFFKFYLKVNLQSVSSSNCICTRICNPNFYNKKIRYLQWIIITRVAELNCSQLFISYAIQLN